MTACPTNRLAKRPPLALEALPQQLNLPAYCLAHWAVATPETPALEVWETAQDTPDQPEPVRRARFSFAEVLNQTRQAAGALAGQGLKPGDRVLVHLQTGADFAFAFMGAMAAGFVPVPVSEQMTPRERADLAADCGAALTLCVKPDRATQELSLADFQTACRQSDPDTPFRDTQAEDPAFLIYTSGTTSRPKGVLHAHRVIWGRRPMFTGWHDLRPGDRLLHAGALNWTYTLGVGLMDCWAAGATAILFSGDRQPRLWCGLAEAAQAAIFCAVPSLYRQILKYDPAPERLSKTLRHGLTAGEALSPALLEEWRARVGVPLYEALGMSELSTYISSGPSVPVRPGSPGKAQPGREIAILPRDGGTDPLPPGETGLLAVKRTDPGLFLDYWNRPDEAAEVFRGPWFLGGDLASLDEDGYVWHQGRASDLMNAFGYRVAPQEVEEALSLHPAIAEVAVTEEPVAAAVSIIAAFIVVKPEAEPVTPEDLTAFLAPTLATYKQPRAFHFVESLPRTRTGKVLRRALPALVDPQD